MKLKFNKFERVAGLFVGLAFMGAVVATLGVAIKRGWFEAKFSLETVLQTADGIHDGTIVQMSGLRVGSITDIELKKNNAVHVKFDIERRFHDRVRQDSILRVVRPFIIGEKILEISGGSETSPIINENQLLVVESSVDIMEFFSGKTLAPYLELVSRMSENLRFVAEAFADPSRTKMFVRLFDDMGPLVKNVNNMSKEIDSLLHYSNREQKLAKAIMQVSEMTIELSKVSPEMVNDAPQFAKNVSNIAANMSVITEELKKTLPAIQAITPDLPRASRRAIEALDETVITLKAIQKSFLFRGAAKDARDEDVKKREEERKPASSEEKKNE